MPMDARPPPPLALTLALRRWVRRAMPLCWNDHRCAQRPTCRDWLEATGPTNRSVDADAGQPSAAADVGANMRIDAVGPAEAGADAERAVAAFAHADAVGATYIEAAAKNAAA
jgi:hypothetical protein